MTVTHAHDHVHGHSGSPENPWAGRGAVMLDIGGDVGALVVAMPASMVGTEIEIRPVGSSPEDHHPHVAVLDRAVAGEGTQPSLVFGELAEGAYELYTKGGGPVQLTAAVVGGRVTELTWP